MIEDADIVVPAILPGIRLFASARDIEDAAQQLLPLLGDELHAAAHFGHLGEHDSAAGDDEIRGIARGGIGGCGRTKCVI